MLSQLRTVGAGLAVSALCFMLASLSWQHLLFGFALASVVWAFWSWSAQLRPPAAQTPKTVAFEPRRRRRRAEIYGFPAQEFGNQSSSF